MTNITAVTVPMTAAVAINVVNELRGKNPHGALRVTFANVALFAGLAALGEYVDWNLAGLLALLYLMSTVLTDGEDFINWFSSLVTSI